MRQYAAVSHPAAPACGTGQSCRVDKVDKTKLTKNCSELTNVTSTKVSLDVNSHKVWCNATFGQETAPELTGMLPEAEVCFNLSQWTLPFALKQLL